jgi:hypothetical protein
MLMVRALFALIIEAREYLSPCQSGTDGIEFPLPVREPTVSKRLGALPDTHGSLGRRVNAYFGVSDLKLALRAVR